MWMVGCANAPGADDEEAPVVDSGGAGDVTVAPEDAAGAGEGGVDSSSNDTGADAVADTASTDVATDATSDAVADAAADAPASDAGDSGAPVIGMSWPAAQVFPSFASVGDLDVVLSSGLANDVLTLATTLQGIVNRTKPRIYISDDGTAAKLWLTEMSAKTTTADTMSLVTKYRSELAGIVVYDDTLADTLNLATTIAGVKGGVVASPALAAKLQIAPYNLPVLADLRSNHFASKLDVYQYELDNYASLTTHRLLVGLTPSIVDHLRDYAVATTAMMVWLDPTVAAEKTMLGKFLALLAPNSPYMGWWTNEPVGVQTASTYGVPVYAADWSMNLTVLGGTPRGITAPTPPPPPALEKKLYVAIFMSDGDNLQEDQGLVPLKWADAARGTVPISWTISPALVDVGPVMMRYYWRTATLYDQMVSGPSGLGYTYPQAWPTAAFDQYTKLSASYMGAAGLRVATVWNNGADLSAANAQSYATNMPDLLGLTIQDSTTARQFISDKLPVERMALSYGDTEASLESGVDGVLKTFDGSQPMFAAIQGDMNMGAIQPTAFADVQRHYATNTNIAFVRADHFFHLLSVAHAPPAHKVFSGDFTGDGKTDVLFYSSNGDFWLGTSDGTSLTWTSAGNQSGFGNLLDGGHDLYTGDFNGDGKTDIAFFASDNNWWLGASTGTALTWTKISTTSFGSVLDGKHSVHVGDYDGDHKTDFAVLGSDGSWSLGISTGTSLTWKAAGSTSNFGNLLDGAHALYDGDFDGDGKADLLFVYNGDQNIWLGKSTGSTFMWSLLGNTKGYGNIIDYGHRLLAGDFDGDKKTDLLFYSGGDGNWWLGTSSGTALSWGQAATTAKTSLDPNHRIYPLDIDGDGKLDVAVTDSGSGDWEVGHSDGHALTWKSPGNTSNFGDLADPSRLLFFGDFDGDGKREALFYYAGDGNWWMSRSDGTSFTWHKAGNTSNFGDLTH
jgi:hypothetical protein